MNFSIDIENFHNSKGSAAKLCSAMDNLHIENAILKDKITELEQKLLLMHLRKYGKSSEKNVNHSHQGTNLFGNTLTGAEETKSNQNIESDNASSTSPKNSRSSNKKNSGGRKPFPDSIERKIIEITVPSSERHCSFHGTAMKHFKWEETEKIEVTPAKVVVLKIRREVVHCPACEGKNIQRAPTQSSILPKSSVTDSTLAHLLIEKFLDGKPIYRQLDAFKRQGLDLSRSTVSSWMIRATEALEPICQLIQEYCIAQPVIYADETTLQVLNEPGRKAEQKSYMWVLASQYQDVKATYFHYSPSRSTESLKKLIGPAFTGHVHCDGYAAYKSYASETGATCVACWAHVRRKFVEALKVSGKSKKSLANYAVSTMDALFKIERNIKHLTPEEKIKKRNLESRPIVRDLFKWAEELLPKTTNNTFGRAIKYMLGHKESLQHFLENEHLELSNNYAERIIKTFVIGRKAWLFSNTPSGAKASAIASSILITCKLNNIEPHTYLTEVFQRIASGDQDFEAMLPWKFSKSE